MFDAIWQHYGIPNILMADLNIYFLLRYTSKDRLNEILDSYIFSSSSTIHEFDDW